MAERKRAKYKQLSTKHYIEQEEFEDTKGIIRTVNRRRTDNTMSKRIKDKQRSTKHTHKTKDRATNKPG
jgi:hypothetical protein